MQLLLNGPHKSVSEPVSLLHSKHTAQLSIVTVWIHFKQTHTHFYFLTKQPSVPVPVRRGRMQALLLLLLMVLQF